MRVVFVASEYEPVAKVGGLGDVAGSLARFLAKLGHEVTVFLPRYASILPALVEAAVARGEISLPFAGSDRTTRLLEVAHEGVRLVLIDEPSFFQRVGVYGYDGGDHPDNAQRFGFLSRAAIEACEALSLEPDVLHVHDWQAALVPVYRRALGRLPRTAVVLTLHNLAYQGIFDRGVARDLALSDALLGELVHGGGDRINFLKGGILLSTLVSTVSPTYAREILAPGGGAGLEGALRTRAGDLRGILNGIDSTRWNPMEDPELAAPYGPAEPTGKRRCKNRLQRELGLVVNRDIPILAAVGRLDPQKGFDLVAKVAPYLLDRGSEIVLLGGAGSPEILAPLREAVASRPDRAALRVAHDEALARRIYAGADFFLMPSRFEPCGLGQMIALRYGTIPIVRATGGLADTIVDAGEDPDRGNGFVFREFSPEALQDALDRALTAFDKKARFGRLVTRALSCDFSWDRSAKAYLELYEEAIRRERTA
jgi:starch synthase